METREATSLKVCDLHLAFGGVDALVGVSLEVRKSEIMALIGPNGAGKTCLLNCVSGFYRPQQGEVHLGGRNITKLHPHQVVKLKVARTFQQSALFADMTVVDNLLAARHIYFKTNFLADAIYFGWAHKDEIQHRRVVEEMIDFLEIESARKGIVGTLPYGLRKRVDLGRALCMEPELLLLDEPMAGMNLEEKEDMARFILDVSEESKTTILLVEHDMEVVMDIADRVTVLDFGKKIAEGSPEEIRTNATVIKSYLGEEL